MVLAYHLAILRFHGRFIFSGGFVGVDVFFVISGFLISSVILTEIAASKFSLFTFYERRIRRIFPALIFMCVATSILAYKYLLPTELMDYAKSLVAATFSVSNVYFWQQSGYFDAPAAMKPLFAHMVVGRGRTILYLFPVVFGSSLSVFSQKTAIIHCSYRSPIVRSERDWNVSISGLHVLSGAYSRVGAVVGDDPVSQDSSTDFQGYSQEYRVRGRRFADSSSGSSIHDCNTFPRSDGVGALRWSSARHCCGPVWDVDSWPSLVVEAVGIRRTDFLFSLPMALADYRLPWRWCSVSSWSLGSGRKTNRHRRFVRCGYRVLEIR
jgi:hypothetical protein